MFYFGAMFNISLQMSPGLIQIQNYETTKKVLQLFGGCIQKLSISYVDMKQSEVIEINELIRIKCADKIILFGVTIPTANMFHSTMMSSIFPNVDSVSLSGGGFDVDIKIDLNEKFPKWRTLELDRLTNKSNHLVDRCFPHLECSKVYFPYDGELTESQIECVLQKNPTVKRFTAVAKFFTHFA